MVLFWYFFIIIVLITHIVFDVKRIENYTNQPKLIILMGDSILDNKIYVEKSVVDNIRENISNSKDKLICIAKDNSTIEDMIVDQLPRLNQEDNNKQTYIFVSVGGNDILQQIVYRDASHVESDTLKNICDTYDNCVKQLVTKMNKSHVVLLTVYYPHSTYYKNYVSYIQEWNKQVKEIANKYHCRGLDVSDFMKDKTDFTYGIEPSNIGGKKIADNIIKSL